MHVHGGGPRVEKDQVFLDFADTDDGRLEDALDINALLRVHHLIVAFLELSVDVDVFYVELRQVLEHFIIHPSFNDLEEWLI